MKRLFQEVKDTLRAIPGLVTALFILSVVSMNLIANKSIFNLPWLEATSAVFISWIAFLCMDVVCKRFGSRASTILNTVAMLSNFIVSVLFMLIMKIPGTWSAGLEYEDPSVQNAIHSAIDATFSSSWCIVVFSACAMFCGGLVNSVMNRLIGKKLDTSDTFKGFAIRSYLSTALGQYVDNIVFYVLLSTVFFGWTAKQLIMCSFFEMLVELVFEIIFSPIGYCITKSWVRDGVGEEYIHRYVKN